MTQLAWLGALSPLRRSLAWCLWRLTRFCSFATRACECLAAGTSTEAALLAGLQAEWTNFAATREAVDAGLYSWEQRLYDPCIHDGDRVLVVGCGAGRDAIALATRGLAVRGVDVVPEAVRDARQHAARRDVAVRFDVVGDGEPPIDGEYDIVVFSYFCYTYIRTAAARARALADARAHLAPNGCILVSVPCANPPPHAWSTRLLRLSNGLSRTDWRAEPGDVFSFRLDDGRLEFQHVFTASDLEREIGDAGFRVSRRFDDADTLLWELRLNENRGSAEALA